jgi:hypothetical protein
MRSGDVPDTGDVAVRIRVIGTVELDTAGGDPTLHRDFGSHRRHEALGAISEIRPLTTEAAMTSVAAEIEARDRFQERPRPPSRCARPWSVDAT